MASRYVPILMDCPQQVAVGAPLDVSRLEDKWVQVGGSGWTATISIEGTIDGTTWEQVHVSTTADIVEMLPAFKFIRCNVLAYMSGAPVVSFAGRDHS